MKCQICEKEGLKSKLFNMGSSSTLLGGTMGYYDEEGEWVNTDPNTLTTTYECSNGHIFSEVKRQDNIKTILHT